MSGIFRPVRAGFSAETERSRGVPYSQSADRTKHPVTDPLVKAADVQLLIASLRITFPLVPAALLSCVNLIGFGQEVCPRLNTSVEFDSGACTIAVTRCPRPSASFNNAEPNETCCT